MLMSHFKDNACYSETYIFKHFLLEKGMTWTAFDICEAWAIKRGYSTARTNRPGKSYLKGLKRSLTFFSDCQLSTLGKQANANS